MKSWSNSHIYSQLILMKNTIQFCKQSYRVVISSYPFSSLMFVDNFAFVQKVCCLNMPNDYNRYPSTQQTNRSTPQNDSMSDKDRNTDGYNEQETKQAQVFEPVQFVYTQTIGSLRDKLKELVDPYVWSYEDILQPRPTTSRNHLTYYYLFHIAPIYNWLRKASSSILQLYLSTTPLKPQSHKSQLAPKTDTPSYKQSLKNYIDQWEVVKLCVCAKVKVISTKARGQMNSEIQCVHLVQKQTFTSEYSYSKSRQTFQCDQLYCEECQRKVKIQASVSCSPFAPILKEFYGKEINCQEGVKTQRYELTIMIGNAQSHVRSANGVWYEVSQQKSRVVSFDKINLKNCHVFIYQKYMKPNSDKVLMKATPLASPVTLSRTLQAINESDLKSGLSKNQESSHKIAHREGPAPNKLSQPQQGTEQIQQLEEMSKKILPVILNKKTTDRKVFKEYKKAVEQLIPKGKEKDDYEMKYDMGKVKKIRKNKQKSVVTNFFDLYKSKSGSQKEAQIQQSEVNAGGFKEHPQSQKRPKKQEGIYRGSGKKQNEDDDADQMPHFSKKYIKKARRTQFKKGGKGHHSYNKQRGGEIDKKGKKSARNNKG